VKQYNQIVPVFPQPGTCQMDLMDLSRFASHNRNYKFIFNVIDVYNRYAWSFPLKRKVPHEIAPKLEFILKQLHAPICFTFDKGSEFKGNVLRYYYGEQLIKGTQLNESFEKLLLKNKKQNKEERELKQEFKKPIKKIKKQIVQGKRIKKPNPKYNII
jgi:hypothetical protein